MQMGGDDEAKKIALQELMQFAKGGMGKEMRERYPDDGEAIEHVPGAEPEEGGEACMCEGEAGPDGMCAECHKMKPEAEQAESKASPDKLRAILAKMKAGQVEG